MVQFDFVEDFVEVSPGHFDGVTLGVGQVLRVVQAMSQIDMDTCGLALTEQGRAMGGFPQRRLVDRQSLGPAIAVGQLLALGQDGLHPWVRFLVQDRITAGGWRWSAEASGVVAAVVAAVAADRPPAVRVVCVGHPVGSQGDGVPFRRRCNIALGRQQLRDLRSPLGGAGRVVCGEFRCQRVERLR